MSELCADFEAANEAAVEFVKSCSAEEWATNVPGEDWSVGVVIHHFADSYPILCQWIEDTVAGTGVSADTDMDSINAKHAVDWASVTPEETADLLEINGASTAAVIISLEASDLEKTAPFGPADGQEMSVERMAALPAIHCRLHLGHAKEAIGRT
ncbi:MAG TPA: DinB family protein [Acidimicrobiales bacterium]|nr:DinB family protein [Acidimicrobiales bacterium]